MEINDLEQCLIKQRGWSLRQPYKENIVLMLSGGLDSSLLAEICIKELNANVYPFYVQRGAKAQEFEERASRNVVAHLKRKYGDRIGSLRTVVAEIPPSSLKQNFDKSYVERCGYPMRNALAELYAVQYAVTLSQNDIPVHTIAAGSIGEDISTDSQPPSFLATTLAVCVNLNDWQWQIVSPYLIESLLAEGSKVRKQDIVRWGWQNQFPFHLTRSCTSGQSAECKVCTACKRRHKLFKQEGIAE